VPGKAGSSKITKAGLIKESEETTHLSVIDAEGNAVSVTTTLNDSYGSKGCSSRSRFLSSIMKWMISASSPAFPTCMAPPE